MVYSNKVSCSEEESKVEKKSKLKDDIKSAVIFLVIMVAIGIGLYIIKEVIRRKHIVLPVMSVMKNRLSYFYLIKQKILRCKILCFTRAVLKQN